MCVQLAPMPANRRKPPPNRLANRCPTNRLAPQVFWECGGMLSAPAISAGVIHKVMAFVAPKIIGGDRAPCPVGELGFVEMTQVSQHSEAAVSLFKELLRSRWCCGLRVVLCG